MTRGLGSRRFRLRAYGPGGHSWTAWGTPNPIHALGRAVASFAELRVSEKPRSTLSVGRWSGGTSVNSIPQDARVELEVRSESLPELDRLEAGVRTRTTAAVDAVNRAATRRGRLKLSIEVIGERPVGCTKADTVLVRAAVAATRAVGAAPEFAVSSTDANIPMSLGIPAVTIGAGGAAGLTHTTDEWYRNDKGPEGLLRALLTLMMVSEETEGAAPPRAALPHGIPCSGINTGTLQGQHQTAFGRHVKAFTFPPPYLTTHRKADPPPSACPRRDGLLLPYGLPARPCAASRTGWIRGNAGAKWVANPGSRRQGTGLKVPTDPQERVPARLQLCNAFVDAGAAGVARRWHGVVSQLGIRRKGSRCALGAGTTTGIGAIHWALRPQGVAHLRHGRRRSARRSTQRDPRIDERGLMEQAGRAGRSG